MNPARILTTCLLTAFLTAGLLPAAENKGPRIDPKALEILKRMSTTLGSAKAFTYRTKSFVEVPASTGQFLTFLSTADVALQRPNKLRAQLSGEAPRFDFFYDGATVAAFAPETGVYSETKAPGTIDAMLPDLENETGIRFATTPLLLSNPYQVLTKNLTSAVIIGSTTIQGIDCTHLAFRAPGVNWEIWIDSNTRALPRRLAVTFTDRPNFPRTIVEFSHWNLRPWLRSGEFVFRQPVGAKEIPFASVLKSSGR